MIRQLILWINGSLSLTNLQQVLQVLWRMISQASSYLVEQHESSDVEQLGQGDVCSELVG